MRIIIVHNFYQQPGGEDVVARQESELLMASGHQVRMITRSNRSISGKGKFAGMLNVLKGIWWPWSVKDALDEIVSFRPDVVHIHNLWYQFNPYLIKGIKARGIPVVVTLHNFRLTCANAILLRNNLPCRKCVRSTGLWGVYHKCYRNSYFLSLCSFLMSRIAGLMGVWRMDVDRFVCLTGFSKGIFRDAGLPQEKLVVKPNFLADEDLPDEPPIKTGSPSAAFLGRFTADKGLPFLLGAWGKRGEKLNFAGTGDLPELPSNAEYLGQLSRPEAAALLGRSWVLIAPALAHETFGLVILEAFRAGTPVLASSNGTFDTLIDHGRTGLLFKAGDEADFHAKLDLLMGDEGLRMSLAAEAKREFLEKYTEKAAYGRLESLYAELTK
jgi:glycosyltransferase involved in cell wall biosynthesis